MGAKMAAPYRPRRNEDSGKQVSCSVFCVDLSKSWKRFRHHVIRGRVQLDSLKVSNVEGAHSGPLRFGRDDGCSAGTLRRFEEPLVIHVSIGDSRHWLRSFKGKTDRGTREDCLSGVRRIAYRRSGAEGSRATAA